MSDDYEWTNERIETLQNSAGARALLAGAEERAQRPSNESDDRAEFQQRLDELQQRCGTHTYQTGEVAGS